jgi:hypothetical protein
VLFRGITPENLSSESNTFNPFSMEQLGFARMTLTNLFLRLEEMGRLIHKRIRGPLLSRDIEIGKKIVR